MTLWTGKQKHNTKNIVMQPILLHSPALRDIAATPPKLARDIVDFFKPTGLCLDPCRGNGVFYNLLQEPREWCEIEEGRDFYSWYESVDWTIGNPPFSHWGSWLRHSMEVSKNILYIIPAYKIFTSSKLIDEIADWGGFVHIRHYGAGGKWGFPFGHATFAIHIQKDYTGFTEWSRY